MVVSAVVSDSAVASDSEADVSTALEASLSSSSVLFLTGTVFFAFAFAGGHGKDETTCQNGSKDLFLHIFPPIHTIK